MSSLSFAVKGLAATGHGSKHTLSLRQRFPERREVVWLGVLVVSEKERALPYLP